MARTFFITMALGLFSFPAWGKTIYFGQTNCGEVGSVASNPICDWRYLEKIIAPGDTVRFVDGTYSTSFPIRKSGTTANPIRYEALNPGKAVILGGCSELPCPESEWIPGAGVWINANHIQLSGLTLKRWGNIGLYIDRARNVKIQNIRVLENGSTSIMIEDSQQIQLLGNTVVDSQWGRIENGSWRKGQEAVTINSSVEGSSDITVRNNRFENIAVDGLTTKGARRVLIQDNQIRRSCSVGIYSLEGSQIAIYRNSIKDAGYIRIPSALNIESLYTSRGLIAPRSTPNPGDIVKCVDLAGLPYGKEQGRGISLGTCDRGGVGDGILSDVWVGFNEISHTLKAGMDAYDHCQAQSRGVTGEFHRIYIFNNTFHDLGNGSGGNRAGIWLDSNVQTALVANNIISQAENGIIDNARASWISHNLIHNVNFLGMPGLNAIFQDPEFVDPAQGNLQLQSTSPAIGSGIASIPGIPFLGGLACESSGFNMGAYMGCGVP